MQEEAFCNFHSRSVRKFNLLVSFSLFYLVLHRCPSQWPLLWSHCSLTNCTPRRQKLVRTDITSCTHCTIPNEYPAGKKDSNTKTICQQNIIHGNVFDALYRNKVISPSFNKREILQSSLQKIQSNRNNTSFGAFTIYLALEEEGGMSQPRAISDSKSFFKILTAFCKNKT